MTGIILRVNVMMKNKNSISRRSRKTESLEKKQPSPPAASFITQPSWLDTFPSVLLIFTLLLLFGMWFIIAERKKKETCQLWFLVYCKKKNSTSQCALNLNTQQDCVTDYHFDRHESGSCKFTLKCYEVAYFSSRHRCRQHMKLNWEFTKVLKVFYLEVRSLKETLYCVFCQNYSREEN